MSEETRLLVERVRSALRLNDEEIGRLFPSRFGREAEPWRPAPGSTIRRWRSSPIDASQHRAPNAHHLVVMMESLRRVDASGMAVLLIEPPAAVPDQAKTAGGNATLDKGKKAEIDDEDDSSLWPIKVLEFLRRPGELKRGSIGLLDGTRDVTMADLRRLARRGGYIVADNAATILRRLPKDEDWPIREREIRIRPRYTRRPGGKNKGEAVPA